MKRAFLEERAWYGGSWEPEPAPFPPTPPDLDHKSGPFAKDAPKDAATLAKVGVIFGRFLPVHVGHVHLAQQAFAQCGMLYVLSPERPYTLPFELHNNTLGGSFEGLANVVTRVTPKGLANPADPVSWAAVVKQAVPHATTLFSSDDSGGAGALAAALGIEHVLVDPQRKQFPISSSDIRADLYGRFRWLPRRARPYFTVRVAVVGAEGAGKSTLAREVATMFDAPLLEDQLRVEAMEAGGVPAQERFSAAYGSSMARQWQAGWETASGIAIFDDTAVVTRLWAERLGMNVQRNHEDTGVDLWLLCHNDFPFQGPPERDDPSARALFVQAIERELAARDRQAPVVHVRGEGSARVAIAAAAIEVAREKKRAELVAALS